MIKKYAVFSGEVYSQHDGDHHFVSADQLVRIFNLDRRECVLVQNEDDKRGRDFSGLIKLFPRYEGDYTLPGGR
jgi:hypothetical protein